MDIDISAFKDCHILVVGDLMIDEYLWGVVDRISPEAPVQVVSVDREEYTLGGSGNVINNLVAQGATVSAAGVIGAGSNGKRLLRELKKLKVQTEGIIAENKRPTTRKTRIIAAQQQVLRIDREVNNEILKKTRNAIIKAAIKIIRENPKVKVILVNIMAGITRCDEMAMGILEAIKDRAELKLVIRLVGTREKEGRALLENAKIEVLDSMDKAAKNRSTKRTASRDK